MGTTYYLKGAEIVLEKLKKHLGVGGGQTTEDKMFTLDVCRCIGACNKAQVMFVDEDQHDYLAPETVVDLLAPYYDGPAESGIRL